MKFPYANAPLQEAEFVIIGVPDESELPLLQVCVSVVIVLPPP